MLFATTLNGRVVAQPAAHWADSHDDSLPAADRAETS